MKQAFMGLELPPALKRKAMRKAKRLHLSTSQYVRGLLRHDLEQDPKPNQLSGPRTGA